MVVYRVVLVLVSGSVLVLVSVLALSRSLPVCRCVAWKPCSFLLVQWDAER